MCRLPLVLLAVVLPAYAQSEAPDAGTADAGTADAGAPPPPPVMSVVAPPGVGRHFAFTWDSEGPKPGEADVQLWATPRWGRADGREQVDVRAGFVQGLPRNWAAGVFIDATPSMTGVLQTPGIDGRLTLRLQNWNRAGQHFAYGSQVELGAGLKGLSAMVLVSGDAWLGPLRVGVNLDGFTETGWPGSSGAAFGDAVFRQTVGLSYTLANGFSFAVELQNRLAWLKGRYEGDAFYFGPSIAYRGRRFWWSAALLPQVAAVKPEHRRGVGDTLELVANERFTLRLSMGLLTQ
ncbi:MAG: hypothetical protein JNK82_28485 [Myxococcaceae bacterium]|nr:hypothetical protein [Myxococcaceae bacterium]